MCISIAISASLGYLLGVKLMQMQIIMQVGHLGYKSSSLVNARLNTDWILL